MQINLQRWRKIKNALALTSFNKEFSLIHTAHPPFMRAISRINTEESLFCKSRYKGGDGSACHWGAEGRLARTETEHVLWQGGLHICRSGCCAACRHLRHYHMNSSKCGNTASPISSPFHCLVSKRISHGYCSAKQRCSAAGNSNASPGPLHAVHAPIATARSLMLPTLCGCDDSFEQECRVIPANDTGHIGRMEREQCANQHGNNM